MNLIKQFFEIRGQAYFKELLKDILNTALSLYAPILNLERYNICGELLDNRYKRCIPLIMSCCLLYFYNNKKISWKFGVLAPFILNSIFYFQNIYMFPFHEYFCKKRCISYLLKKCEFKKNEDFFKSFSHLKLVDLCNNVQVKKYNEISDFLDLEKEKSGFSDNK
jgi:hypothetical protein